MRCLLFSMLLLIAGCGSERTDNQHQEHNDSKIIKTTTIAEKTVATEDGPVVVESIKTTVFTEEVAKGEIDAKSVSTTVVQAPELKAAVGTLKKVIAPVLAVADKVATVAEAATPWGMIAAVGGTLVTALTGAYATSQKSRATAAETRADEHKADSDEAWAKILQSSTPSKQG